MILAAWHARTLTAFDARCNYGMWTDLLHPTYPPTLAYLYAQGQQRQYNERVAEATGEHDPLLM